MKINDYKTNRHHVNGSKGFMGGALIALAGIFFILRYLLPDQQLWLIVILAVGAVTILISHVKKSKS